MPEMAVHEPYVPSDLCRCKWCRDMREQNATIPALLENIDRLTVAINSMPEWAEGVKAASWAERDLLRAALKEALDFWSSSLYSGGRLRDGTDNASARIRELRKLVAP